MLKKLYSGCLLSALIFCSPAQADINKDRDRFLKAEAALKAGKMDEYQRLRKSLSDYPLSLYLDFNASIDDILHQDAPSALGSIKAFKDSPLELSARHRYLLNAGKKERWNDFLYLTPELPKDTVLQCYYYLAKLKQGDKKLGLEGARRLWVHGSSRPEECDPLFAAWIKSGGRTQEVIWSRMFLAYEAGEEQLLSFLAQKVTSHPKEAQKFMTLYKDPRTVRHTERFKAKAPVVGDMVAIALKALARKDLLEAVKLMEKYEKAGRFTKSQASSLHAFMIRRILSRQEETLQSYADKHLASLKSDDLTELRLRWAIRDGDSASFERYLPLLSAETAAKERWQYWQARIAKDKASAAAINKTLAADRNFYAFHLSDELGIKPTLKDIRLADSFDEKQLAKDDGFNRFKELLALDRPNQARIEWFNLLSRHEPAVQTAYGRWVESKNMYLYAVDTSIQAKFWDDLSMRFPFAEEKGFTKAAQSHQLNKEELRSIARRESAFNPKVKSPVGALGLMQVMPATAKQTAKNLGLKYTSEDALLDPAFNIRIGSAYYAGLLKRYNNNRVLATAAYNAGPSRVNAWLARSGGKLDVMAFIESIPFKETREYVQAVLSYRVIYEQRQGINKPLFSDAERHFKY
ncbi:transglycosylase SLT domain-containing protein [Shewanella sp. JM162201]|uniref:Transglycosylase SLT domain-containing protein n=1 Tax=Shewanella jiangmenensis TaxID=2837387 RepID=A0ABS5V523_9GAMM|nr:transglycosylase SLT domain-containing protein [Shewanella jiangmenensis]MBT1445545.1 transglycosylase SLT domain-containing protein [Shewanella jiangmenensis]